MKKLLVIATICALSAVAADDKAKTTEKKKPAGGAMMAPKPAPEARELRELVGTWKTQDTVEKAEGMMVPGGEGASTETITLGPGGYSVVMHVRSTSGPMANFRGVGVLAWNPEESEYKFAWVESMMPGLAVATGHKEGNDIVMNGEVKMGGKAFKTKDVISDRTATTFTLTSYVDDGSGEKKVMTMKATKEEKPAAEKATK